MGEGGGEGEMIRFPLPYIPSLQGRGDFEWVRFPKLVFGPFGLVSNFVFGASNLAFPVLTSFPFRGTPFLIKGNPQDFIHVLDR
jgi:hypothetical protein